MPYRSSIRGTARRSRKGSPSSWPCFSMEYLRVIASYPALPEKPYSNQCGMQYGGSALLVPQGRNLAFRHARVTPLPCERNEQGDRAAFIEGGDGLAGLFIIDTAVDDVTDTADALRQHGREELFLSGCREQHQAAELVVRRLQGGDEFT